MNLATAQASVPLVLSQIPTSPPTLPLVSRRACTKPQESSRLGQCESWTDQRAGSESPPAFRTVISAQGGSPRCRAWNDPLSEALLHCQSTLTLHRSGSESPPVFWGPLSASSRSSLGRQSPCPCSVVRSCASTCEPSGTASPCSYSQSPGCTPLTASDQRSLRRALQAELSLLEKDRRIESLEARVRELEGAVQHEPQAARRSLPDGVAEFATAADVEALCRKSGALVERLASLRLGDDAHVGTCGRVKTPPGPRVAKDPRRSFGHIEARVLQKPGPTLQRRSFASPPGSPPRFRRASAQI